MPALGRECYPLPTALTQCDLPPWACSLLHWETQDWREQAGRREHVMGPRALQDGLAPAGQLPQLRPAQGCDSRGTLSPQMC